MKQSYLKTILHYDSFTGNFRRQISRNGKIKGTLAGSKGSDGYIRIGIEDKTYLAHRLAQFIRIL